MKSIIQSVIVLVPMLVGVSGAIAQPATATETQPVNIRFTAKVGNIPFACGATYRLGRPAANQTLSDFRFYVSEVALIDANGNTVPINLEQDGKWQYRNIALLDFEDKTGACVNGTTEMRDRIIGTVPKGKYTGLKFTLGLPFALNHEDAALAPSPLNLTGLWWNWQLGYKFVRIDLQNPITAQSMGKQNQHGHQEQSSTAFPIHLGSTGCQAGSTSEKPTSCKNPNRATVVLSGFDPAKNIVVADLAQLVATANLKQNQPKSAPGCMSDPNDGDCMGIMTNLGLSFMGNPVVRQTFFRIE